MTLQDQTEGQIPDSLETTLDSPFGKLLLRADDEAITRLTWLMDERSVEASSSRKGTFPGAGQGANRPARQLLDEAISQLEDYFQGRRKDFDLPLAPAGTVFQQRVWHEMAKIPFGETMTYGQLAEKSESVARAVGGACGANPIPIIIPCHRVLGGGGKLGGFSGGSGPDSKRALLEHEGVLTPGLGF